MSSEESGEYINSPIQRLGHLSTSDVSSCDSFVTKAPDTIGLSDVSSNENSQPGSQCEAKVRDMSVEVVVITPAERDQSDCNDTFDEEAKLSVVKNSMVSIPSEEKVENTMMPVGIATPVERQQNECSETNSLVEDQSASKLSDACTVEMDIPKEDTAKGVDMVMQNAILTEQNHSERNDTNLIAEEAESNDLSTVLASEKSPECIPSENKAEEADAPIRIETPTALNQNECNMLSDVISDDNSIVGSLTEQIAADANVMMDNTMLANQASNKANSFAMPIGLESESKDVTENNLTDISDEADDHPSQMNTVDGSVSQPSERVDEAVHNPEQNSAAEQENDTIIVPTLPEEMYVLLHFISIILV